MCTDDSPASLAAAVRHEVEPAIEIDLEPADSVAVVTLMDNVTDVLMTDQGPARRADAARIPWRPLAMMEEGRAPDSLIAEHGFSVLVTVAKAGQEHRFLFDAGTSPDGAGFDIIEERQPSFLFGRSVLTGDQPLYALLGGFHLGGPLFEPLIPRVLDDLAALNPGVLVPAHCTGWRAQHAMSARFPDVYVPSAVGTSFLL